MRASIPEGDTAEAIKTRLGEPLADFGPGRVFVYGWGIRKGSIGWIVVWPYGAASGAEPWVASSLVFVAFDGDGKVLKVGTRNYSPLRTMSGQVHRWLSSNRLSAQVPSPRPDAVPPGGHMVVLYRPSTSPCPFMLFDFSIFKLKITVDGRTVGDLPKGAYLASVISPDAHVIGIQSYSDFFQAGSEGIYTSYAGVNVTADPDQPTYVEAYLCTGQGDVQVHATVRDAQTARKAMRGLKPAW